MDKVYIDSNAKSTAVDSSELIDLLLNTKHGGIDDRSLMLFESIRKKENAR